MYFPDVPKPESTGGSFLRLKNGESVRGVFQGDIKHHYVKWDGKKNVDCGEKDDGAKVRFRCNFVLPKADGSGLEAKIFEFPWDVFADLKSIHSDSPLNKMKVKITRFGDKTDTRYQIMPVLGKEALSEGQLAQVENVKLLPLEKPEEQGAGDSSPMPDSSDIPF